MSAIDEIRQKTDIVETIGRYVTLKKAGRTFRGLCPFHAEKNPSFFVYPEQQSWHCFGCNTGGDVFSFIMKKENTDFKEALRLLADRAGVILTARPEAEKDRKEKERLYQVNEAAAQYFHGLLLNSPAAEKTRAYITDRGLSAKTILDFKLGYAPNAWESLKHHLLERGYNEKELVAIGLLIQSEDGKTHDRFRHKLMFPIADQRGRIIGFGARVLDDSLPKYINSPQTPLFDKSGNLYALNFASAGIRQQDSAVIVEGYFDAIIAHQHGFNNVVASMGTSITERQVSLLKKLTRNVILALDADTAGAEAMQRGVSYENVLEAEVRVVTLPEGKDPDDVIRTDTGMWQKLLADAVPIIDYVTNLVTAKLDLTTARDKSLATEKLLPIIAEIKDPVRQSHYLQKLARLMKISDRSLEAALSRAKSDKSKRGIQLSREQAISRAVRPHVSNPLEEYCLSLLLQYPDLKRIETALSPEHFDNSENREIFLALQKTDDVSAIKESLDTALHEYFDSLVSRDLQKGQMDLKYLDCVRRLEEKHLKSLEAKKAEILAQEAEMGGTEAELAKLQEQGIETSVKLGEIYSRKNRRRLQS